MMIRTFDRPPQVKPSKKQQELLGDLQNKPFTYFVDQINLDNGLVADSNWTNSPASIAAVGFSLPVYAVGIEHACAEKKLSSEP
jgi:hypothetical protein